MHDVKAPSFCEQKDCPSGEAKKLYDSGAWEWAMPLPHHRAGFKKSFWVLFSKSTASLGLAL
jgi:hypothetical protein